MQKGISLKKQLLKICVRIGAKTDFYSLKIWLQLH